MLLDLTKYIGLEYAKPYDCLGLVEAVRKDLGLKTPYKGQYDGHNSVKLLRKNSYFWKQRQYVHIGAIGDIILTSDLPNMPWHHCGVVVSISEMIHILPGKNVTAVRLSELFYHFPGGASRWFYAN